MQVDWPFVQPSLPAWFLQDVRFGIPRKRMVASYTIKAVTLPRDYGIQVEFNNSEAQYSGMEMGDITKEGNAVEYTLIHKDVPVFDIYLDEATSSMQKLGTIHHSSILLREQFQNVA